MLGGLGKTARLAGVAFAGMFAGQKVVSGFKSVVKAASDAQQSLGATETVFKDYANTVVADSNKAAKTYGLSANVYRENANLIGSLFKNQGVATKDLAGKTKGMIGVASDLAATFGGTTTTAVEALGSAFKGEFDPLEKYGISLKQSTVNAEASSIAQKKYGKSLKNLSTAQQAQIKQEATSNLIRKQSKDSTGAFAKETDTLAHQQQVLKAQFDNVKVAIGTRLLPVLTKFLTYLTENGPKAIESFKKMAKPVTEFFKKFKTGSGGATSTLTNFLTTAKTVWEAVKTVISTVVKVITVLWQKFGSTLVAYVMNSLNNILLVIRGVFQVIKGVFDVFAGIFTGDWKRVWEGIKGIVSGLGNVIKGIVKQLWNAIKTLFKAGGIAIKAVFVAAWNGIKAATTAGISKVVSFVKGLPGKIKSAIGDLGGLLKNAGKKVIQGLLDGISSMVGKVKDKLKGITKLIPLHKGPISKDKVLLTGAGQAIIQGLINGMDDKEAALKKQLKGTTRLISGGVNPYISGTSAFALSGAGHRTNVTIKVDVPVGADPISVGREIDKVLKSFYSATGARR